MKAIKVESASITQNSKSSAPSAKTTFSILVTPNFQNPRGFMHGGAQALLVDMCTTMAVAPLSSEEFWHFGGLTRTLNVTCLKNCNGTSSTPSHFKWPSLPLWSWPLIRVANRFTTGSNCRSRSGQRSNSFGILLNATGPTAA